MSKSKKTMKELVAYAKRRAKEHHKYGRSHPMSWNTHFDCHWMTRNIYKDCGYPSIYNRIIKKGKPYFYKKPWASNRLGPYLAAHRKSGLTPSLLRGGDIVVRPLSGGGGYHSAIYIGGGKVAETTGTAKGGRGSHIGRLTKKYTYAFRVPEPYSAKYEVLKTRAVRKSWTSKSEALRKLKPGTIFKVDKRRGNWVHVTKIRIGKEWKTVKGWVCIQGKSGKRCKKIK